jgi:PAS domain S-box-containing protein
VENFPYEILHTAIEAAESPLVVTDATLTDNPIVYANPAYLNLSGYKLSDVVGKNARFMHGKDKNQPGLAILRESIKTKKCCTTKIKNTRKDGTKYLCSVTIKPVFNIDGNLTHWVGTQRDITAESTLELWAAVLAHDLKTPLIGSTRILNLIARGHLGEVNNKQHDSLMECRESLNYLLKDLNNMLTLLKCRQLGRCPFGKEKKSINLHELIQQVLKILEQFIDSSKLDITYEPQAHANAITIGNSKALLHAIQNIVDNSLKHSADKHTSIGVYQDEQQITIQVSNKINYSLPENLFAAPWEAEESTTFWSTRVGLHLAQEIIEEHHGSLSYREQNCNGEKSVTFYITLPCAHERDS